MSFMPQGSTPQTSSFTCNTCGIKFVTAELQRQHMKTDWHRYNLKRRVAQLPSISSDVFAEKVLASQLIEDQPEEDEFGFYIARRKVNTRNGKQLTKESLTSQNWTNNSVSRFNELVDDHVRSASPVSIRSRLSEFSLGDSIPDNLSYTETGSESNFLDSDYTDIDTVEEEDHESEDSDSAFEMIEDYEAVPISSCFFCGENCQEIELNVKHMFSKHGLYIPERSFLIDLPGLLTYISGVISIDHECLVCGFQGKNLESIRQHISSKGHSTLPYESKEDRLIVSEFYDFTVDEQTKKKSGSNKKVAFTEESDNVIIDVSDDDFEEDEINSNYSVVKVDKTGVELTLPTGSKIGHRSMVRYYRQNITLPTERGESQRTVAVVDRRLSSGLSVHEVRKQEKETRKLTQRAKNIEIRKTKSRKANYQPHFRDEILGT